MVVGGVVVVGGGVAVVVAPGEVVAMLGVHAATTTAVPAAAPTLRKSRREIPFFSSFSTSLGFVSVSIVYSLLDSFTNRPSETTTVIIERKPSNSR
jgi:hypothetical protein